MIKKSWNKLSSWLSRLKARARSVAFKEALTEMAVTVATSTLPVWFFPLVAVFLIGVAYAAELLDHSVSEGELFLFSTSLVGPLLYILFRVYEVPESEKSHIFKYKISLVFPHALKFAAIVFFICIVSASIFGFQKINPKFSGGDINKSGYIVLSIVLFTISIVAMLIAIMFRNEMDNYSPSKMMRKEEDDFAEKYKSEEPQQ